MAEQELLLRRLNRERAARQEAEAIIEQKSLELYQAKLKAEIASRAKTEFLNNISHELRTPLNHIIGFAKILHDYGNTIPEGVQEEYLANVLSSSEALAQLVEQLLELSNLDVGSRSLNLETVELRELIESCVSICTPRATNAKLNVKLAAVDCLGEIECDPAALKRAITNVLGNAIKFTPEGGRIEIRAQTPFENEVLIVIEDSGIGIKREHIQLIQFPFYQVDGGLGRRHEGAGIGLSIARMLIELHRGTLKIESHEGEGTVVYFALPRYHTDTGISTQQFAAAV